MIRRKTAPGFTLLEVLTALTVAALAALIAMPALVRHHHYTNLRNAALKVSTHMLRARFLAVAKNCRYRIRFDPAAQNYHWEEDLNNNRHYDEGEEISPRFRLPVGTAFDARDILGPPSNPTQEPPGPVTFNENVMSVGPDGRGSNPGAVYLANEAGDHVAITVGIAGRVRIWDWDPETRKWK